MNSNQDNRNNENAINAFIALTADIEKILARLGELAGDHFNVAPDDINWGNVGTLHHLRERLCQASDFIFQEGECAG